jgi:hypothetical protein
MRHILCTPHEAISLWHDRSKLTTAFPAHGPVTRDRTNRYRASRLCRLELVESCQTSMRQHLEWRVRKRSRSGIGQVVRDVDSSGRKCLKRRNVGTQTNAKLIEAPSADAAGETPILYPLRILTSQTIIDPSPSPQLEPETRHQLILHIPSHQFADSDRCLSSWRCQDRLWSSPSSSSPSSSSSLWLPSEPPRGWALFLASSDLSKPLFPPPLLRSDPSQHQQWAHSRSLPRPLQCLLPLRSLL